MKTARSSYRWSWLLFFAPFVTLPAAGCMFLKAPEPEPTPTPAPVPTGIIFNPGDANPQGAKLNDPANPALPDFYRLARIESGQLVWLQGFKANKAYPNGNIFRLAGIVAPAPKAPGWQSSVSTLANWASNQDLTVHLDPKFPYDLNNRQVVNVIFKGRKGGKWEGQEMSLNRMMVRSGFALVDLYSPTSFDVRDWLKDEAYARKHRLGLWQIPGIFQQLQQRRPVAPKGRKLPASSVTVQTSNAPAPPPLAPSAAATGAPGEPGAPGQPPGTP